MIGAMMNVNALRFAMGTGTTDDPAEEFTHELDQHVPDGVEELIAGAGPYAGLLIGGGISVVLAIVVTLVVSTVVKQIFRRHQPVKRAINRSRMPTFCILFFAGAALSVRYAVSQDYWWQNWLYVGLLIAMIISIAWWALRVVKIVEAIILSRYIGEEDPTVEDRRGRRLQTQVTLIGRILAAVIITVAVAAILLLNESVRGLGAGILASAGVVSVVAGLAMQSTLANLFAGIQLAFTDSIRVGDVVIIEGNYGSVEEITLSTVVLKSWDGRRFIYPSAHFVATPFENWTRVGTQLTGTVEFDLDWRVPMGPLRTRFKRLLAATDLWDGETDNLQLIDAVEGFVKVRVAVSARNSGDLWDLRCLIREDLVNFIRSEYPSALLTQRVLHSADEDLVKVSDPVPTGQIGTVSTDSSEIPTTVPTHSGLFTGSIQAVQRNRDFAGPGEGAYRERKDRNTDGDDAEGT